MVMQGRWSQKRSQPEKMRNHEGEGATGCFRPSHTDGEKSRGQHGLRRLGPRHSRSLAHVHGEPGRLAVHLQNLVRERECLDLLDRLE